MTFHEIMLAIKLARKATPVSAREAPWGVTRYDCSCGYSRDVLVCYGVGYAWSTTDVPPPAKIVCSGCGQRDASLMSEAVKLPSLKLWPQDTSMYPYLRVPSRRAAVEIAKTGRLEAQLVMREDPLVL